VCHSRRLRCVASQCAVGVSEAVIGGGAVGVALGAGLLGEAAVVGGPLSSSAARVTKTTNHITAATAMMTTVSANTWNIIQPSLSLAGRPRHSASDRGLKHTQVLPVLDVLVVAARMCWSQSWVWGSDRTG